MKISMLHFLLILIFSSCSFSNNLKKERIKKAKLSCLAQEKGDFNQIGFVLQNISLDTIKITDLIGSKNIPLTLENPNGKIDTIDGFNRNPFPNHIWELIPGSTDTITFPFHAYFDYSNFIGGSNFKVGIEFKELSVNSVSCPYNYSPQ